MNRLDVVLEEVLLWLKPGDFYTVSSFGQVLRESGVPEDELLSADGLLLKIVRSGVFRSKELVIVCSTVEGVPEISVLKVDIRE